MLRNQWLDWGSLAPFRDKTAAQGCFIYAPRPLEFESFTVLQEIKKEPMLCTSSFLSGRGIGIRTPTIRVRVVGATVTQFPYIANINFYTGCAVHSSMEPAFVAGGSMA